MKIKLLNHLLLGLLFTTFMASAQQNQKLILILESTVDKCWSQYGGQYYECDDLQNRFRVRVTDPKLRTYDPKYLSTQEVAFIRSLDSSGPESKPIAYLRAPYIKNGPQKIGIALPIDSWAKCNAIEQCLVKNSFVLKNGSGLTIADLVKETIVSEVLDEVVAAEAANASATASRMVGYVRWFSRVLTLLTLVTLTGDEVGNKTGDGSLLVEQETKVIGTVILHSKEDGRPFIRPIAEYEPLMPGNQLVLGLDAYFASISNEIENYLDYSKIRARAAVHIASQSIHRYTDDLDEKIKNIKAVGIGRIYPIARDAEVYVRDPFPRSAIFTDKAGKKRYGFISGKYRGQVGFGRNLTERLQSLNLVEDDFPIHEVPIELQGGDFATTSKGLCAALTRNEPKPYGYEEVLPPNIYQCDLLDWQGPQLCQVPGCKRVLLLPKMPIGSGNMNPWAGHLDEVAKFVRDDAAVMNSYKNLDYDHDFANDYYIDWKNRREKFMVHETQVYNLLKLAGFTTVVKLPMPPPMKRPPYSKIIKSPTFIIAQYVNSAILNSQINGSGPKPLLIQPYYHRLKFPHYDDKHNYIVDKSSLYTEEQENQAKKTDEEARRLYEALGFEVAHFYAPFFMEGNGAAHCGTTEYRIPSPRP